MNDLGLLTLLAVRLRSRGTVGAIAVTVAELDGRDAADAGPRIDELLTRHLDAGRLRRRGEEGRHSLTPAGEAELSAQLAAELVGPDRADVATAYEAFLPINRRFLATCVDWQVGSALIDDLAALVHELGPVIDSLTTVRSRFASYGPRLVHAVSAASDDPGWVDSPSRDSVHTVWFELHEHLLASLGRERVDEPVSD